MPKISKITTQKRKGRYNLFLDEQFAFGISESVLIQFRLAKGLELTDQEVAEIKAADQKAQAYQLALRYLEHQLRTEREIRQYLAKNEINQATQIETIKRLKDLNYLDDQHFADSYVRTLVNTTNKGPGAAKLFLITKGVSQERINQALTLYDAETQLDHAMQAADKLTNRYRRLPLTTQKQKVTQSLMTQGFSGDVAKNAVNEIDFDIDDDLQDQELQKNGDRLWRRYQGKPNAIQKLKQGLFRKGYSTEKINAFIDGLSDQ